MKNYDIYFEIFGKKMKTTILAQNEIDAKSELIDKIKFHKVEESKDDVFNQSMDGIAELMDILKDNKK